MIRIIPTLRRDDGPGLESPAGRPPQAFVSRPNAMLSKRLIGFYDRTKKALYYYIVLNCAWSDVTLKWSHKSEIAAVAGLLDNKKTQQTCRPYMV